MSVRKGAGKRTSRTAETDKPDILTAMSNTLLARSTFLIIDGRAHDSPLSNIYSRASFSDLGDNTAEFMAHRYRQTCARDRMRLLRDEDRAGAELVDIFITILR